MPLSSTTPRRVALYIDSLKLGGAERVTLRLACWLRDGGWQPLLLTRKPPSWDFYPIPVGVQRMVEPADPAWVRRLGPFGLPWRLLRLRRWMRRQKVTLVIGITTIPAVKLLLALRGLNVLCVVSERNNPPLKPVGLPWRLLRRLTYPWADLHLVQTEAVGRWLREHVSARHQLHLPNPVTWPLPAADSCLDPQLWLAQAGVAPDDPVLLAVGTKSWQKGFDRLVDWFRLLAVQHPRLQLVIVGLPQREYHGRDQWRDLQLLLEGEPDLLSRLHSPGPVGNVQAWYERATLFVLSSRYEGFPNVLLEAMATGCCCISADCPHGPAELIEDGRNGRLMAATASNQQWVNVLDALLTCPSERQRLGLEAQAVRRRYAPEQLAQRFTSALELLHQ